VFALLLASVLGQGERFNVDRRFRTPDAALTTYWQALRTNDAAGAWECLENGPYDMPFPGMVWFLPPTEDLRLTGIQALPVQRGRVVVTYEVRYRPEGLREEFSFRTASELVLRRGEWRITQPIDTASIPGWRPSPRPTGC
jgi:hypothetical protein